MELMVELQQEEIKALREELRQEEENLRQRRNAPQEMRRQEERYQKELHRLQKLLDQRTTRDVFSRVLIASDQPCEIREVIEAYPEFTELYRGVFDFRYHKKELVSMYSEALRILDQNTKWN